MFIAMSSYWIRHGGVMTDLLDTIKSNYKTWLLILVSFGLAILLVVYIARHRQAVEGFIKGLGVAGPLAVVGLYITLGASPIPSDPLTVINGAMFGPVVGGLLAWLGTTLAALVEYYIGTKIGDAADFEKKQDDLPLGLGKMPVDSVWFLLGGRMLTGAGSKVVSLLSGIYEVSLWRYLWTTALSTLWGAVVYALGGFGLLKLL
jgi:uncharacterized membrane protein YdjX (TVP38/TMEM64 family)